MGTKDTPPAEWRKTKAERAEFRPPGRVLLQRANDALPPDGPRLQRHDTVKLFLDVYVTVAGYWRNALDEGDPEAAIALACELADECALDLGKQILARGLVTLGNP